MEEPKIEGGSCIQAPIYIFDGNPTIGVCGDCKEFLIWSYDGGWNCTCCGRFEEPKKDMSIRLFIEQSK